MLGESAADRGFQVVQAENMILGDFLKGQCR